MDKGKYFRRIPKVDILLEEAKKEGLLTKYDRDLVVAGIRQVTDELRSFLGRCEQEQAAERRLDTVMELLKERLEEQDRCRVQRVINGTGTLLHTNLGRSPIGEKHAEYLRHVVTGYSNLEYDLDTGGRGERYSHFEDLVCQITGGEAAVAVNNNAAAVLLILSALVKGKEAIVSRGELVEIGGKFRIPEVMEQSGGILREVGTTNKTRLEDYRAVIGENTGAILKVHTSNYRITGFTESVGIEELAGLGAKFGVPVIEDLGSGVMVDLRAYGLSHEPMVQESIRRGADIVCFSGDKLLGGPQAGIITGKKEYIDKMKRHPLMRAMRIDKFTVTVLEQIFREYRTPSRLDQNLPVFAMLSQSVEQLKEKAVRLADSLHIPEKDAVVQVEPCASQVGGGALPGEVIESFGVTVQGKTITCEELEERLRKGNPPVICRVEKDRIWLDMRTIQEEEIPQAAERMNKIFGDTHL